MKATAAALAAALLAAVLLADAALPVHRNQVETPGADAARTTWGGLLDLPANGTLVVQGARYPYTPEEVLEVRAFLESGGRVLVADPSVPSASLVRALDVGIEVTPAKVFDPDIDAQARFTASGTGVLGVTGTTKLSSAHIILGDGDPFVVTGPFTWQDRNADGVPDLGEPRGSWAVARLREAGRGQLLVLGTSELLSDPLTADAIATWVRAGGDIVADGYHRSGGDPLDATPILAGHRSGAVATVLFATLLVGALVAWSVHARRITRRRRRRRADVETLEMLAELEA